MRETADEKKRRRRRYPDTAEYTGKHLVMTELLRRGFEAEFAGASYEKHDMLVRVHGSDRNPFASRPCIRRHGTCAGICLPGVRIR